MRRMQLFFQLGSWTLIVIAALHLMGFLTDSPQADSFSFTSFAVLMLFVGVSNLVMMRVHRGRIKGLRVMAMLNAVLSAALFAASWAYSILPLLACFGLCLLFFGLAVVAGQYQFAWERTASQI